MNTKTIIRQAETDTLAEILTWVREVVEGRGQSVSQMVVTVVLGCIPGVGQALDAYNILRALHSLTRDSDNADNWIELVLCLIALVPLFGDALKNVFRMLRSGMPMGRILDSLPRDVRGNIEKWFRELDWASYTRQLVAKTNQILDGMIDVLGTRSARWMMDKQGLNRLIAQLRSLKAKAQQKIEQAMGSLQQSHQMAMAQPLPNTTAGSRASRHADTPRQSPPGSSAPASSGGNAGKPAQQSTNTTSQTPAASSTPAARRDTATGNQTAASAPASKPQQQPATSSSASSGRSSQTTTDKQPAPAKRDIATEPKGNTTPAQGQVSPQLRQSQRSRYSRHRSGVQGEHIADYDFVKRKSREKINNGGILYEGRQPGHQGIDHVWIIDKLSQRYRISDTKSTNEPFHKKLESATQVWQALEYGLEKLAEPSDKPKVRNSVGKLVSGIRQMSHTWISMNINRAKIIPSHRSLLNQIERWRRSGFDPSLMPCPYERSIITVVGPNFILHDPNARKKSANSKPLAAGLCSVKTVKHQIATEFELPLDFLDD
ncbi:hypothetical protein HCG45_03350 [Pseudomonas fulva]|uniref:hypothetical protein n=1 Tax=Pseudomonas fulva TaxID=47880 RepID=UPI001428B386|nr:hypothetical protein [Pseudomonas fulva]NIX91784.1 hypothetical protein [Pseudomonas fulva]